MPEQAWEYCELCLRGREEHKRGRDLLGISYNCWIDFMGPDGNVKRYILAEVGRDRILPFNPWRKALGLLGGMGWEVVSVQHGNRGRGQSDTLAWHNRVAHLKRVVVPGRAVDEPYISFQAPVQE